jgi:hypothetical protein
VRNDHSGRLQELQSGGQAAGWWLRPPVGILEDPFPSVAFTVDEERAHFPHPDGVGPRPPAGPPGCVGAIGRPFFASAGAPATGQLD